MRPELVQGIDRESAWYIVRFEKPQRAQIAVSVCSVVDFSFESFRLLSRLCRAGMGDQGDGRGLAGV